MSCAQIAHMLKVIGKGHEITGIKNVFKLGVLVGVGCTTIIMTGGIVAYVLYKAEERKCEELQERVTYTLVPETFE